VLNVYDKTLSFLKKKVSLLKAFFKDLKKRIRFSTFKTSLSIPTLIILLTVVLVSSIFLPEIILDLFSYTHPKAVSDVSLEPIVLAGGAVVPGEHSLYGVGDKRSFVARKFATGIKGEEYELDAVCKAVGKFCYVFVEEGQEVDNVWVNKLRAEFDEEISAKKKIANRFKSTLDNDGRITLLLIDIKDGWDYQKKGERYIAGFFWGENQVPGFRSKTGNEADLLYLDINPANASTKDFLKTVSHELDHLVHQSYIEVRVWLIIFLQVGFISFFVLHYFLEGRWKGKL